MLKDAKKGCAKVCFMYTTYNKDQKVSKRGRDHPFTKKEPKGSKNQLYYYRCQAFL